MISVCYRNKDSNKTDGDMNSRQHNLNNGEKMLFSVTDRIKTQKHERKLARDIVSTTEQSKWRWAGHTARKKMTTDGQQE